MNDEENDQYDGFESASEESLQIDDHRYAGAIIGRVQRRPGVGHREAREIASKYAWYREGLKYDGRCKRWHVFRERG